MKRLLLVLIGSSLLAFAACGGGESSPEGSEGPASSPSPGKATPTAAQLEELTTTEVAGFVRSDSRVVAGSGSVLYTSSAKTAGGANVLVNVRLSACDPFICGTLNPKDYEGAEAQRNLKATLPAVHIENPDLVWESGSAELSPGRAGLYTYALSYVETRDAAGGVSRASVNAYRAWYHNGSLHIMLEVFGRGGGSAGSAADLSRMMSRADASEAAKSVFGAFAAAFER
ncbi:MAG: hypothetical protein HUU14_13035 [Dehalococcoidia bacterium]|nr:hypothetical protein [Dehalococcoidia bacterium]NUQ56807.1 hypothetical protein [Dehalococcoidia bacterium]